MKAIFLYCFVWCILQNVGYAQITTSPEKLVKELYVRDTADEDLLHLEKVATTSHEFMFRYWDKSRIFTIIKEKDSIYGTLTTGMIYTKNSIFRKKNPDELVSITRTLPDSITQAIYAIANPMRLDSISQFTAKKDTNYIYTHLEHYKYEYKQDTAYSLITFTSLDLRSNDEDVQELIQLKNLISELPIERNVYKVFRTLIPIQGGYSYNSTWSSNYSEDNLIVGYDGTNKMPYGLFARYYTPYIGKHWVNMGTMISYATNFKDNYFLDASIIKHSKPHQKKYTRNTYAYTYQNRRLDIKEHTATYQNHLLRTSFKVRKYTNWELGINYLHSKAQQKLGGHIGLEVLPNFYNFSFNTGVTIYNTDVNYKLGINRNFRLKSNQIKIIEFTIYYEKYLQYQDWRCNVLFRL